MVGVRDTKMNKNPNSELNQLSKGGQEMTPVNTVPGRKLVVIRDKQMECSMSSRRTRTLS